MNLRKIVSEQMVAVHKIRPELADHHVAAMDNEELMDRFTRYTGMELSVADPKTERTNVFTSRFSRPATMTAGLAALNPVPDLRPTRRRANSAARFGSKKPGPKSGSRVKSASRM